MYSSIRFISFFYLFLILFSMSSLCNKIQWNKYFYKNQASLRCNKQSDEQTGRHVLIDFSVDAELENIRVYSLWVWRCLQSCTLLAKINMYCKNIYLQNVNLCKNYRIIYFSYKYRVFPFKSFSYLFLSLLFLFSTSSREKEFNLIMYW